MVGGKHAANFLFMNNFNLDSDFDNLPASEQQFRSLANLSSQQPDSFDLLFHPEQKFDYETGINAQVWKMQADYNSASEQMARAQKAGINANTAAGAVAGNGAAGASADAGIGADSSLPAAASATGDLVNGASSAIGAFSNLRKIPSEIGLNDAKSMEALSNAGWNDEQRKGIEIDNKYRDSQNLADLNIKLQQFDNMLKEWDYIQSQNDLLRKEIDSYDERIKAELDLERKQALEAEKRAKEAMAHAKEMELRNDFFETYHFDSNSPVDVSLRNSWISADFDRYKSMLAAISDYFNANYSSQYNAQASASWLSRPSNPYETAAYIGKTLGDRTSAAISKMNNGQYLNDDDYKELEKIPEMQEAYDDYVDWLKFKKKQTAKEFWHKNSWNPKPDNIQELYNTMKYYEALYDNRSFKSWFEKSLGNIERNYGN